MSHPLATEVFRRAAASIEVPPVTLADVVTEARDRRRRRRRRTAVAAAVAVAVVAATTWLATRGADEPPDLGTPVVRRQQNPVDVAWYADGRLHLDAVTVELPALSDLVELNGGAVYADLSGTVAFVSADGERRRIGEKDAGSSLVSSSFSGWVAWLTPGDAPQILVHDVRTGETVATHPVPAEGVHLIAIDQTSVFYRQADDTYSWTPGTSGPDRQVRAGLVDVESATRVYQEGRRIDMVQSLFNVDFRRPGLGGRLSAGGTFVLSRRPEPGQDAARVGAPYRPLLYDARSGDSLTTGVAGDERVVDAAFGDSRTVTYLVGDASALASDPAPDDALLVLRTCQIGTGACSDLAPVPISSDRPLLAQ